MEKLYLEEARNSCATFPKGDFTPNERPDFLLARGDGTLIGIEVTELSREQPRAEAGKWKKTVENAKKKYSQLPDARPVDVVVTFSPGKIKGLTLINALVEYVHEQNATKTVSRVPTGYNRIGVHEPLTPTGHWQCLRESRGTIADSELLESRIAEKNKLLPDYHRAASSVWLLIVNDQFLGPGEVYPDAENLLLRSFIFNFDKVLLFCRKPHGTGKVHELRRA